MSAGAVTQTLGSTITVNALGVNANSIQLAEANPVSTVALQSSAGATFNASGALTVGSPSGLEISGANALGGQLLIASDGGSLTLTQPASGSSSGDAVVLSAGANFINMAGAAAITANGGGRWLVFSTNPASNADGGLIAAPLYDQAFDSANDTYGPIANAGNRFVYTLAPVLTVTATGTTDVYDAAPQTLSGYSITGYINGDAPAAAASGAPGISGSATNVGSYSLTPTLGSLTSDYGYQFHFAAGALQITPATLTYVANTARQTYGSANTVFSGAVSGFLGGDTQANATTGTLAFTSGTGATTNVGSYAITGSGLTADNGNYNFVQAAGNAAALTIAPYQLTAGLIGTVSKVYDGALAATLTSANYTLTSPVNGDLITLNDPTGGTYDTKNVGTGKTVTVAGLALGGTKAADYVLASTTVSGAIGTITPKPLTYSVANASSDFGIAPVLGAATLTGVIGGDAVMGGVGIFSGNVGVVANASTPVGTYTEEVVSLRGTGAGNYSIAASGNTNGVLTINPSAFGLDITSPNITPVLTLLQADQVLAALRAFSFTTNGGAQGVAILNGHVLTITTVVGGVQFTYQLDLGAGDGKGGLLSDYSSFDDLLSAAQSTSARN